MSERGCSAAGHPAQSPAPLGRPRLHLRETDSTNARARALAIAGAPHGTLVSAAFQTAGRGRQGRRWSAPPGDALLASLIVRSPPPLLPLIAAVAVCDLVPAALIKWPNDIVVTHELRGAQPPALAKLAGILIEGRPQEGWAVLGMGLNVAVRLGDLPPALQATAATLGGSPADVEPLLARLLAKLARRLAEPAVQTLRAWRAHDALLGRGIGWEASGAGGALTWGHAAGIDGDGRLAVSLQDGGQATLTAGEVHLRDA